MSEHEHDHDCGDPSCGHDHHEMSDEERQAVEKHMEALAQAVGVVLDAIELPPFLDPDDPLHALYLDMPQNAPQMHQAIFDFVRERRFKTDHRVALLEAIDELDNQASDDLRRAGNMMRSALLEPQHFMDTDWMQLQVVARLFIEGVAEYSRFWRVEPAQDDLLSNVAELIVGDNEAAATALAGAGREGLRAIADSLEDYGEILDDFEALSERDTGPLLRMIEVVGRIGGLAGALTLADQLTAVNHPEVEKAIRAALTVIGDPTIRVIHDLLEFEALQPASRFVLYEVLAAVGDPELPTLAGRELTDPFTEQPDLRMSDDDLEDLAELWAGSASGRQCLIAAFATTQEWLPEPARAQLETFLDAHPDTERVAWARARIADDMPVLLRAPHEMDEWATRLGERWECDPRDPRVASAMDDTPAIALGLHSMAEVYPSPGPKEEFLSRIAAHEVPRETQAMMQQTDGQLPPREELEQMIGQLWWLRPRGESGWKPPLISIYKERRGNLPEDDQLRDEHFRPLIYGHLREACMAMGSSTGDPQLVETHLSIANEFLPKDDPLLRYANRIFESMAAAAPPAAPGIWTPDQGAPPPPPPRPERKVGRNEPCPCGSGKKYKKCCLGR